MLLTSGLKRFKSLVYIGELTLLRNSEQLTFLLNAQLWHVHTCVNCGHVEWFGRPKEEAIEFDPSDARRIKLLTLTSDRI